MTFPTHGFPSYARQAGLSLVELMVGMMVGLIGIIIISHLYITNEQYKRSTTGSGAAQVNGAIALYSLERDLRMAGYGVNNASALGCACDTAVDPNCSPVQYFYNGTYSSPPAAPGSVLRTLQIAPVVIVKTPNQPDSLTLLYSGDNERSTPSKLTQTMSPPNYDYNADGTAGFDLGNSSLIVVTQGTTCVLAQTTVNAANSLLVRAPGAYNPVQNGNLHIFSRDAAVITLGQTPVWRTYTIANNRLVSTEVLPPQGGAGGQALVDDIFDLQALYGKDTGAHAGHVLDDKLVDVYDGVTPTTAAGWQQVLAVRIAVLARSQNYEKPTAAGVCTATVAANQPRWGKSAVVPAGNTFPALAAALAAAGSEAGCYKYRAFETIVPLRNMIWR